MHVACTIAGLQPGLFLHHLYFLLSFVRLPPNICVIYSGIPAITPVLRLLLTLTSRDTLYLFPRQAVLGLEYRGDMAKICAQANKLGFSTKVADDRLWHNCQGRGSVLW